MRPVLIVLLALALVGTTVAVAPTASAAPPDCGDVLGEAKCEQIRDDVRDLLICTCPPL